MIINGVNFYKEQTFPTYKRSSQKVTEPQIKLPYNTKYNPILLDLLKARAFYHPVFGNRKIEEEPLFKLENYITPTIVNPTQFKYIKRMTKPNGDTPFKKDKDVLALMDGLRSQEVRDFQLLALDYFMKHPAFEKGAHIAKIISQINTIERGQLFIDETEKYSTKYPDMTSAELISIIPRLSPEKLELQQSLIEKIYLPNRNQKSANELSIFSEFLSSIEDNSVAKIQLDFFENLMKKKDTKLFTAMSLLMNIEDKKKGIIKKNTILNLINKGFKAEDLVILIPKIKNKQIADLNLEMADYFLKDLQMESSIAAKIMCNISDKGVFDMHKNIIKEASALRHFEDIDILKILGDIQSAETAELKMAVIKMLANIEKFNGEDITKIVTNVDTVYGAEIKVKVAKKLAEIDKLSGNQIGYIVAGCHNEESARVKSYAAEELIKIPEMTGEAIAYIVARLLKSETANIQINAVKRLVEYDRFSAKEIAKIVRGMRNIDFSQAKFAALEHLITIDVLDNKAIVEILDKINGESKDKYLLACIDRMVKDPNFNCSDITKIAKSMFINKHTCNELIDYFATIPREIKDELNDYSAVQDFYPFKDKKNFLNRTERKAFIAALIKHNSDMFDNTTGNGITKLYPFLPSNNEDYCQLLPVLTASVDKNLMRTNSRTRKAIAELPQILEGLYEPNSTFLKLDFENPDFIPKLRYSLADFKEDVKKALKDCPEDKKEQVTDQFGFVLSSNKSSDCILVGYPQIPKNYNFTIQKQEYKEAAQEIERYVDNFINHNDIKVCNDEKTNKLFYKLLCAIPELTTLVGKPQNEWHHFDTFVHTLRVMQEVAKNERFQKLNEKDKQLLFIAALLHDISKAEGVVDKGHALTGAYDAYQIADKLGFSSIDKSKLFAIIRNHEWLKYYNKEGVSELQKIERAKTVAFTLREGNAFELVSILSEADLKGMQRKDAAYNMYEKAQREGNNEVARYVRDLQRTAIPLPQNHIPKASELVADGNVIRVANIGGIKNKVIYLTKNMGKGSLPFNKNLDPNDLNFLVHALDSEKNSLIFQRIDEVDNDTLISSSYVNLAKGNWKTFRQQGYILDVDSDNIHAAYFKDYGSGSSKNIDDLKINYLFEGYYKPQRDYISQKIKETLHIDADSYKALYQDIKNKSLNEIREEYPFVSAAIKQIYMEMQGGQYTYGRNYNEVLVTRPRIQGVFAYDRSITQVPRYLRKYAADEDIPIIIFLD